MLDGGRLGMQCDRRRLGYTTGRPPPKGRPGEVKDRERGHAY